MHREWKEGRDELGRKETCSYVRHKLLHILNHYPNILNMSHYIIAVLEFMARNLPEGYQLLADLP